MSGVLSHALVVAADAPDSIRFEAEYAKRSYGDLIQLCDGVGDNEEINAAIIASREVVLSPGHFDIRATVYGANGLHLLGPGLNTAEWILAPHANCQALFLPGSAEGIEVGHFTVNGNGVNQDAVDAVLVEVESDNSILDHLHIKNGMTDNLTIRNCRNVKLLHGFSSASGRKGTGPGIEISIDTLHITVDDWHIWDCGDQGGFMSSAHDGPGVQHMKVSNLIIWGCPLGILLHQTGTGTKAEHLEFEKITIDGTIITPGVPEPHGMFIAAGAADWVKMSHFTVLNAGGRGIASNANAHIYVDDCDVINAGGVGISLQGTDGRVRGCNIMNPGGQGIMVYSSSMMPSRHRIIDNEIEGCNDVAINVLGLDSHICGNRIGPGAQIGIYSRSPKQVITGNILRGRTAPGIVCESQDVIREHNLITD